MKIKDVRIQAFLDKKFSDKNEQEKFLNPKLNDLRDANNLYAMSQAKEKILKAIQNKKKILIFGDYDSDGICSSTMLFLFLKSIGADVDVFIPNRFQDGYGISIEAIEEVESEFDVDLIITVDLGVTAVEEVEILKQENIDIVITDHHLPLAELPDAVIIDPKLKANQGYGFDALCGAGVVFKLIEALSSRDEALKYLDLCAIATVGDIVPLLDENRIIARFGIEKINRGECLPSISFLKDKLELGEISSTDISFKIVPRLNACGRMDSAKKVFEFLIETDKAQLEKKYAEIESDNALRLSEIEKGKTIIAKELEKFDFSEPAALIKGDFHEGIIGILASYVVGELGRPAIIFATDENGNLKGSGRSVDLVDLHEIISSLSNLVENFGGHKMACGVEILPENFEKFKSELCKKVGEKLASQPEKVEIDFDILLTDDDLNLSFFNELELLEPFGCENEKPILALKTKSLKTEQISEKSFKHYRLSTEKNNQIIMFNGYTLSEVCRSNIEKFLILDMSKNAFKGNQNLSIMLKKIKLLKSNFEPNPEQDLMVSLFNKFYSIFDFNNMEKYHVCDDIYSVASQKLSESKVGTVVVASNYGDLEKLENLGIDTQKYLSTNPLKNGKNVIVCAGASVYKLSSLIGYKNIIFLNRHFEFENLFFTQRLETYENKTILPHFNLLSREVFVKVYSLAKKFEFLHANDELDYAKKLSAKFSGLKSSEVLFCLLVFIELNFIEFDEREKRMKILKAKKMELSSSKLYFEVNNGK